VVGSVSAMVFVLGWFFSSFLLWFFVLCFVLCMLVFGWLVGSGILCSVR
jgi:hypothetical protein